MNNKYGVIAACAVLLAGTASAFTTGFRLGAWGTSRMPQTFEGLKFTRVGLESADIKIVPGSGAELELEFSTDDGETWTQYTLGNTITFGNGVESVCFRSGPDGNETFNSSIYTSYCSYFQMNGTISASGNVNSLLSQYYWQIETVPAYCFSCLFMHCHGLVKAPELPAPKVMDRAYLSMFYDCTSLGEAPDLPAENPVTGSGITQSSYAAMFADCTSLKKISIGTKGEISFNDWISRVPTGTGKGVFYYDGEDRRTDGASHLPEGWEIRPYSER